MATGRKSEFSQSVADTICERLANGESLRTICDDSVMPARRTVFNWLSNNTAFVHQYARAREMQADAMDDLILETAMACTNETAQADRLKIDAFKWRASKLAPKRYGDKLDLTHAGEVNQNVRPDFSKLTPDERKVMRLILEKTSEQS